MWEVWFIMVGVGVGRGSCKRRWRRGGGGAC